MPVRLNDFMKRIFNQQGPLKYKFGELKVHYDHHDPGHKFRISVVEIGPHGFTWKKLEHDKPVGPWQFDGMEDYEVDGVSPGISRLVGCSTVISVWERP